MLASLVQRVTSRAVAGLRAPTSFGSSVFGRAAFSTAAADESAKVKPIIQDIAKKEKGWKSRAFKDKSTANYKNLPISPHKLQLICRSVSGLSAREALAQLRLSSAKKSVYVAAAIRTAAHVAKNSFNMEKSRLVVSEAYCTKGTYYKRVEFRARGRANIRHRRHSHLTVVLKEQPYHPHEIRIGRYGRTIEQVRTTAKLREAFTRRRKAEGGSTHRPAQTAESE